MEHIELLNDDVSYMDTHTQVTCCNTCNSEGGGCGCDTYVCVGDVCAQCDNAADICYGCDTNVCGYDIF
jgi:hypothetical protein